MLTTSPIHGVSPEQRGTDDASTPSATAEISPTPVSAWTAASEHAAHTPSETGTMTTAEPFSTSTLTVNTPPQQTLNSLWPIPKALGDTPLAPSCTGSAATAPTYSAWMQAENPT